MVVTSRLTAEIANSRVTGRHRRSQRQRYVGVKCHFEGAVASDEIELFFISGGYGGINSVENGRANLCLLVTYDAFQAAGNRPIAIIDVLRKHHPKLDRYLDSARLIPETLKTTAAVDTSRPATPWQGAPCIGDAAAMITPLCGDGMAMALSASELCVPLADAFLCGQISRTEWAQSYSSAWHNEFTRRIQVGRLLQDALAKPLLADLLIGIGRFAPPLTSSLFAATRGPLAA